MVEEGATVRAHLLQAEATWLAQVERGLNPQRPASLDWLILPPLPPAMAHVWQWWVELHNVRGSSSGYSPDPINHAAVTAWKVSTLNRPTLYETDLILRVDEVFRGLYSENAERERVSREAKNRHKRR